MAFVFRLEKYLKLRRMEEERSKIELGKKISARSSKEEELKVAYQDVIKSSEDRLLRLTKGENLARLNPFFISEDMALGARKKREEELGKIQQEVDDLTAEFVKARGKVKSLENIRDKQEFVYRREMNRKEQNELDELHSIRKYGKKGL